MADYDRYDTRAWERDRYRSRGSGERPVGRDSDRSIFNFSRSDRDDDRSRGNMGGGYDRDRQTSAYDRADDRMRGGREERHFGPDDTRQGIARDETSHLIASNKVEGTAVYGRDGNRLGDIYNFMVDKHSGKVEYAVLASGGFLGMGSRYFPIPWDMLSYDTRQGGYRVEMSERDLERAPSFDRNSEPDYDRNYSGRVHDYYGIRY